jgi:hypothetical protein
MGSSVPCQRENNPVVSNLGAETPRSRGRRDGPPLGVAYASRVAGVTQFEQRARSTSTGEVHAVARSIIRALYEQIESDGLTDLSMPLSIPLARLSAESPS